MYFRMTCCRYRAILDQHYILCTYIYEWFLVLWSDLDTIIYIWKLLAKFIYSGNFFGYHSSRSRLLFELLFNFTICNTEYCYANREEVLVCKMFLRQSVVLAEMSCFTLWSVFWTYQFALCVICPMSENAFCSFVSKILHSVFCSMIETVI